MLIYDIEIAKAIPPAPGKTGGLHGRPYIEYCAGWHDHAGMGVAVIGAYDYDEDRYRVFADDNFNEFAQLTATHEVLVGFNSILFDNVVLRLAGIVDIPEDSSYDLLREIWAGAGLGPVFVPETHRGIGLVACCLANFGVGKSGDGELAPISWQCGEIGSVIDYCLNDVRLTKWLLDRVISTGFIVDPRDTSKYISVRRPGHEK